MYLPSDKTSTNNETRGWDWGRSGRGEGGGRRREGAGSGGVRSGTNSNKL